MHNQMSGPGGMDPESRRTQENTYGSSNNNGNNNNGSHQGGSSSNHGNSNVNNNNGWANMNSYAQTTMADYGSAYTYMPPIGHGLPSESLNNRMPPPPTPMSQPHSNHPTLPMLMVPSNPTWPSMLTNPSSYSAPPITMQHRAVAQPAPVKASKSHAHSQPRRTLTDDDRRKMCEYAEANPGVRQTEIGNIFGVERSTVSKVLRNKDKYLCQEDRTSSPVKRSKSKFPDIERALSNWVRNAQKTGVPVTDADIKEKFRFFATTTGTSDTILKSTSWLEKFKQKNGIGAGRLVRRASETNIGDSMRGSPSLMPSLASKRATRSPVSPTGLASPSPLSATRSDDEKEASHFMDFTSSEGGAYKHTNSQSTTSLSSAFTDTAVSSSFPGSAMSPTAPFSFSPDSNVGSFLPSNHIPPGSSNFQRPRSQTFPTLDLEYMNQPQTTEALTPKYHHTPVTAPSSALESPMHEMPMQHQQQHQQHQQHQQQHYSMDGSGAVMSPQLRHSSSNSSIAPRSTGTPVTGSGMTSTPVGSSPSSPTQEDARRAADTLLAFFNHVPSGFVDQNEYMAVVRLTEKLRIHQHQAAKAAAVAAAAVQGMGGLSRIPEGEVEMATPPMSLPTTSVTTEATTMSA